MSDIEALPRGGQQLLDQMERELAKSMDADVNPGPLFHYTTSSGLLGVLKQRKVRATHYQYLNDSREIQVGESIVQSEAERLMGEVGNRSLQSAFFSYFCQMHQEFRLSKIAGIYVASFSENGDDLSQWRAYGSDGTGYSVGIRSFYQPPKGIETAQAGMALMRCQYDEAEFRTSTRTTLLAVAEGFAKYAETYGRDASTLNAFHRQALSIALRRVAVVVPRLKHVAFADEREWRLVILPVAAREHEIVDFREDQSGIVPYVDAPIAATTSTTIDLDRIVIGPRQNPEAALSSTRLLLKKLGYAADGVVTTSEVPYRGPGGLTSR